MSERQPRVAHRRRSSALVVLAASLLLTALAPGTLARPSSPEGQDSAGVAAAPDYDALLGAFRWRNIGPANMGGRIVDIEAAERSFREVYVATASGGVWKSKNAGNSWEPIFDDYPVVSVGDIAIYQPNPNIVWVGTGEANNRNSVSWGDGLYKSVDGGENFVNKGLEDTHQIARVVTHPVDPNIVYVAAIGHLWGTSGDRGLFKTVDGGETWEKLTAGLPDDGKTGATDLVMDPTDPETLYVAFYERLRQPWHFHSGGPNGGIFKSTDGGRSWHKLTTGLPEGDTGRIGLAIYRRDPKILMALVEAERSEDLATPGSGVYRSEDAGESWTYVNTYNNRPFYYSQIRINPSDDQRVYLLTTRFMVSEDGGKTLRNGAEDEEIHGDFHAMWLDPYDKDRYYIGQDKGVFLTHDHGEHFLMFDNLALGQYYRIGVDMRDPYYVYGGLQDNGTWGGPSFSRDVRGILNDSNWKLHWGDGMYIQVDPGDWKTLYTEAENGSFRRYDVVTHRFSGARPGPDNISNYEEVASAAIEERGLEVPPPGRNQSGATTRAQLGRAFDRTDPLFRFNWTAPLVMSPHDSKTLYLGGNYVFRTTDRGESWTIISPDLSTNDPGKRLRGVSGGLTPDNSGAEQHCAVHTLSESAITPGVIWAGTDDGNVQVTRDGGRSWTNTRPNIPGVPDGIWVSRVEASHFDESTAYVTFDGHRSDLFTPWVFKTTDFGASWTDISGNIPDGQAVQVIREDLRNRNLLFVGTEFALFVSIDGGASWATLMNNLATVPVHDLVIHPRDNDLVAGTHGRSIWILDDITPLQQLTPEILAADGHLFEQRQATLWENVSRGGQRGHHWFAGENPPTIEPTSSLARARFRNNALITYYLRSADVGPVTLEISDMQGNARTVELEAIGGIHRFLWDLRMDPAPMTAEQRQRVAGLFEQRIAGSDPGPRLDQLREAWARFQSARTDYDRLSAAQAVLGGFGFGRMGAGLPPELSFPTAGPGSYLLKLTVGDQVYRSTLNVRPDPILEQR